MKKILIPILLIIFVLGITQYVHAQNAISGTVVTHDFTPSGNLNSQATCTSLVDGTWNENAKSCAIPDNGRTLKIGNQQILTIDSGYTLVVSNSGSSSNGIYLAGSGNQITNNGIIIIDNSGEYSNGIQVSKPSSITNNGIILIANTGRGSNGIFTADYVGCSHSVQAYTGSCATSLTNNGEIIISNTNPPSSSKWDQSNGIYGGKIIDNGIIRVMDKEDAYRELAEKKASDDKINAENEKLKTENTAPQTENTAPQTENTAPQTENTAPQTENTAPQIACGQGTELVNGVCQIIKTEDEFDKPIEKAEQETVSTTGDIFSRLMEMLRSLFNFS